MATGSEQHARRGRGRGGRRTNGGRTTSGRVASKGAKGATSSQERRVEALADELGNLAERLGIRVGREKLLREVGYRARGGFCRVGGAPVLILDSEGPGEARLDLLLDVLGGRDLVVKPLDENFIHIRGLGGASILGDGSVCLLLDVAACLDLGRRTGDSLANAGAAPAG